MKSTVWYVSLPGGYLQGPFLWDREAPVGPLQAAKDLQGRGVFPGGLPRGARLWAGPEWVGVVGYTRGGRRVQGCGMRACRRLGLEVG